MLELSERRTHQKTYRGKQAQGTGMNTTVEPLLHPSLDLLYALKLAATNSYGTRQR